ncbi:MAG: hypothetical protein WAT89_05665 [Candidatus Kapaibacterium sp.]
MKNSTIKIISIYFALSIIGISQLESQIQTRGCSQLFVGCLEGDINGSNGYRSLPLSITGLIQDNNPLLRFSAFSGNGTSRVRTLECDLGIGNMNETSTFSGIYDATLRAGDNSEDLILTLRGKEPGAVRLGTNFTTGNSLSDDIERMTVYNFGWVGIGTEDSSNAFKPGMPNQQLRPILAKGELKAQSLLHLHQPNGYYGENLLTLSSKYPNLEDANFLGINYATVGLAIRNKNNVIIGYNWNDKAALPTNPIKPCNDLDKGDGNYLDLANHVENINKTFCGDFIRLSEKRGIMFFTGKELTPTTTEVKERVRITEDGKVGIGVSNPKRELVVNGTACMKEVFVQLPPTTGQSANDCWYPDYVFEKDYRIMPLSELEKYVRTEKHLPNVPSSQDIENAGGVPVGALQVNMLKQLEELTLHVISQNKRITEIEENNKSLIDKLSNLLSKQFNEK